LKKKQSALSTALKTAFMINLQLGSLAGVNAGCVYLCQLAGNTVLSNMASDTPYL